MMVAPKGNKIPLVGHYRCNASDKRVYRYSWR